MTPDDQSSISRMDNALERILQRQLDKTLAERARMEKIITKLNWTQFGGLALILLLIGLDFYFVIIGNLWIFWPMYAITMVTGFIVSSINERLLRELRSVRTHP
jgi:hypothetical protein